MGSSDLDTFRLLLATRMKTSLGQLYLKYIRHKIWSDIPENVKYLSPCSFRKQYKPSCYLANIPVDFRFMGLSLFCNIVFSAPLFLTSFTSPVAHPNP